MALTKSDIDAVRMIMTDVLSFHLSETNGKIEVMQHDLHYIKEQTTKTNGRVNKHDEELKSLEIADIEHFSKCPNEKRIRELETIKISNASIYRFLAVVATAAVAIAGLAISFYALFN